MPCALQIVMVIIYRVQVMARDHDERDFQTIKVEVLATFNSALVSTIMYLLN